MKNCLSLFLFCYCILLLSCSKENGKETTNEYHELKNGDTCLIYKYASSNRINNVEILKNNFFKINTNLFRVNNQDYRIDSIQTFYESNKLEISPMITSGIEYPFNTLKIKNAVSLTNDSIVGEYYNAWSYNSPKRVYVPDSGIFIIKIK